jgi:hypothetical protein
MGIADNFDKLMTRSDTVSRITLAKRPILAVTAALGQRQSLQVLRFCRLARLLAQLFLLTDQTDYRSARRMIANRGRHRTIQAVFYLATPSTPVAPQGLLMLAAKEPAMAERMRRRESFLPDPTPEEIRRETAAIRQAWSDRETTRRCHYHATPWMPPILGSRELSDSTSDFEASA